MKRLSPAILALLLPVASMAQQDNWYDVYNRGGTVDASGSSLSVTNAITVGTEPTVAQVPFYTAVSMGLVSGYSKVNKFGHNLATTTGEDVWGGGGLYAFYPTNAQTVWAQSSSAGDDTSSTGAHTVVFYGLDSNWLEASETVTMDGTTSVALTNTYIRMFRGVVSTIGTTASNVGTITVTNGAGTVAIHIGAGDGQTQHAVYTVPGNKTAYFITGYVGVSDAGNSASRESCQFKWKARPNNGATGAWATKGEVECINDGSTHWIYNYGIPAGPLPAKTDIRIQATLVSTSMGTVGGFDLLMKDD